MIFAQNVVQVKSTELTIGLGLPRLRVFCVELQRHVVILDRL